MRESALQELSVLMMSIINGARMVDSRSLPLAPTDLDSNPPMLNRIRTASRESTVNLQVAEAVGNAEG